MKHSIIKLSVTILVALALVVGLCWMAPSASAAVHISGTVYASELTDNHLVLDGDTTIIMDCDLVVNSISGPYHLTITNGAGFELMAVDNSCPIDVAALTADCDLNINSTDDQSYAICVDGDFNFTGGTLYARGNFGVLSKGNINISCDKVDIVANWGEGLASKGNMEVRCNSLWVETKAEGESGDPYAITSTGDLYINCPEAGVIGDVHGIYSSDGYLELEGKFVIGSRRWGIYCLNSDITLNGDFTVYSDECGIRAYDGSITINGSAKVETTSNCYVAVEAEKDFSFTGSNLEIQGSTALLTDGNVYIHGYSDSTVTVIGVDSVGIQAFRGGVYVTAGTLRVENQVNDYALVPDGILSLNDVSIYAEDGYIWGYENGIKSHTGNISLEGNIEVVGEMTAINAPKGSLTMNGSVTARSVADVQCCISTYGDIMFNGEVLDVEGNTAIRSLHGNIHMEADSVKVVSRSGFAISSDEGSVEIQADKLYAVSENCVNADLFRSFGVSGFTGVSINSADATIAGEEYAIYSEQGSITLDGTVYAGAQGRAIYAPAGELKMYGSVTANSTSDTDYCVEAYGDVNFDGSMLTVTGYGGICNHDGGMYLYGNTKIVTKHFSPLSSLQGGVFMEGDYILLKNQMLGTEAGHLSGINAGGVQITSSNANIYGYNGIRTYGISTLILKGNFNIEGVCDGIQTADSSVELHGSFAITGGKNENNFAINSEWSVFFEGQRLDLLGYHGILGNKAGAVLEGNVNINATGGYGIWTKHRISFEPGFYKIYAPEMAALETGALALEDGVQIKYPSNANIGEDNIYDNSTGVAVNSLILYTPIETLDLTMNNPAAGQVSTVQGPEVKGLPDGATVRKMVWYEDGVQMAYGAPFVAGNSYEVEIIFDTTGLRFGPDIAVTVNGKSCTANPNFEGNEMTVYYKIGKLPNVLGALTFDITAPMEGNAPSATKPTYTGYGATSISWLESADGEYFYTMSGNFKANYYYRVVLEVKTSADNFSFIAEDDEPVVTATVNGKLAVVTASGTQDPSKYITVTCDMGMVDDTVVENIVITDVYTPVAGEPVRYHAIANGSGYYIDSDKNEYLDVYWKNPPEKWGYILGGVAWYDMTANDWVYENQTFIAGHEYRLDVHVRTRDGYTFAHSKYQEIEFTASINGQTAQGMTSTSDNLYKQNISTTFVCQPAELALVMIDELDAPVGGQTPDFEMTMVHSSYYQPDPSYGMDGSGIYWYDMDGNMLGADDTFTPGQQYKVEIKLIPKQVEGVNICKFLPSLYAMINGNEVVPNDDWDAVYTSSDAVYIYYTFTEPAAFPPTLGTISGTVTSAGSEYAPVEIMLIESSGTEPVFEASFLGNSVDYLITDVKPGEYILRVSKQSHMTQVFFITVEEETMEQVIEQNVNLEMMLKGSGFSLSFEDEILANFYYTIHPDVTFIDQGMLVFYNNPGSPDINRADDVYQSSNYSEASNVYSNTTKGIAAKQMGDDRYYCAYVQLADGSYAYSPLYQYSPKKYAMSRIANSTNAEMRALCVAMLNYGAAAQNFFGYRTDDLMNAGLTEEQKAMVSAYDASFFKGSVAADPAKTVNFTKTATGFASRSASVSFEGAFSINYYFAPSVSAATSLTLYYWTPADYAAADVLTMRNASGSMPMVAGTDGTYWGQVSGIAAKKLDETYYVAGIYTDAEGNTYCTGVIAYSLSKYCLNNAKPGKDMQELAAATAMYGYYAKEYFTN